MKLPSVFFIACDPLFSGMDHRRLIGCRTKEELPAPAGELLQQTRRTATP